MVLSLQYASIRYRFVDSKLIYQGCVLTITRYEPGADVASQQLPRDHGPLIIGQENLSLDSSFGSMSLSDRHDSYDSEKLKAIFVSPYDLPNPTSRSLSYRRDIAGQQLPSALDNSRFSGFTARNAASSSHWSPMYSPYVDYTLQSPPWVGYSPGVYSSGSYSPSLFMSGGYNPGAVGQERGTPQIPQHRSPYHHQQQKGIAKLGGRQSLDYTSGHHNVVDVDRIRQGTDVRTTVSQVASHV